MNARIVQIEGQWYFEFETDHFSVYAVVEEIPEEPVDPPSNFFARIIAFFKLIIDWITNLFK